MQASSPRVNTFRFIIYVFWLFMLRIYHKNGNQHRLSCVFCKRKRNHLRYVIYHLLQKTRRTVFSPLYQPCLRLKGLIVDNIGFDNSILIFVLWKFDKLVLIKRKIYRLFPPFLHLYIPPLINQPFHYLV